MAEIRERIRTRLRERLVHAGASPAFSDPALFDDAERLLHRATDAADDGAPLLLAELLGDHDTWELETALRLQSHRTGPAARSVLFVKRRILLPMLRWLFEFSRDNAVRQRRVNQVLFACLQELAIEQARLRRDVERASRVSVQDDGR